MHHSWSNPTDFNIVCRRAGGRRRYNAQRRYQADVRRFWLLYTIERLPPGAINVRGIQSAFARAHGVHRSTISRDFAEFRRPKPRIFKTAIGRLLKLGSAPPRP